ncbi:MAG TPA: S1 RNA-binding domain-containing protein [Phycisphaerae bacterium]|nr:S1 RNA-binding domain-containing protein [Phycisphaerae bacterium]
MESNSNPMENPNETTAPVESAAPPSETNAPDASSSSEPAATLPTQAHGPMTPARTPPPKAPTPAELAASVNDADADLDRAVEEAMSGVDQEAASVPAAQQPSSEGANTGELIEARIANIGSEDVLVDFGAKMLGVLPKSEFREDTNYAVGDTIEVLVVGEDKSGGLINVSHRKAKQQKILRTIEVGMELEGPVTGMNRGGLEVTIEGLRAFIPASQVELGFRKDISDLIGKTIRAEVTKFDLDEQNIVLSRRRILEREEKSRKEKAFEELQVGEVRKGRVKTLMDFGAFIDIGGVDGLLHISDMSWGRINKPEEVVTVGDEVEVKVTKINKEKGKVSLSLKQLKAHPWEKAGEKYPEGTKISGRVVRLANFGAFVELEPGLDALLPISEMSWTKRVRSPKEVVNEGDVIEAKVLSCEPDKQRISISLKALSDDPWSAAAAKYPVDSKVRGKVVRTTDFGAFVNLEDGVDGLIHISELADRRVNRVEDVVKVGAEVEARVVKIDTENNRIGLSLKEPPPEPTPEELAKIEQERIAAEKRRNKKRRGGLTIDWDQGLGGLDPSKFARS